MTKTRSKRSTARTQLANALDALAPRHSFSSEELATLDQAAAELRLSPAVALALGSTPAKRRTARANGKLGGRPRVNGRCQFCGKKNRLTHATCKKCKATGWMAPQPPVSPDKEEVL